MEKIEIKEIPTSPGIYIFKDEYEEPLYVGKAKNCLLYTSDAADD